MTNTEKKERLIKLKKEVIKKGESLGLKNLAYGLCDQIILRVPEWNMDRSKKIKLTSLVLTEGNRTYHEKVHAGLIEYDKFIDKKSKKWMS